MEANEFPGIKQQEEQAKALTETFSYILLSLVKKGSFSFLSFLPS
jgi:hypothetical protein